MCPFRPKTGGHKDNVLELSARDNRKRMRPFRPTTGHKDNV
jgi:hypothetical protein